MGLPPTHIRLIKDKDDKSIHHNCEPLCNSHSWRLLGQDALGYLTDDIDSVTCLACKILDELNSVSLTEEIDEV